MALSSEDKKPYPIPTNLTAAKTISARGLKAAPFTTKMLFAIRTRYTTIKPDDIIPLVQNPELLTPATLYACDMTHYKLRRKVLDCVIANSQDLQSADDVIGWLNGIIGNKTDILTLFAKGGTDKTNKLS